MQSKQWLLVLVLFLGALGCRELNREYFCPAHPDDPRCGREPDKCGDIMCAAPTPVCDPSTTTCVQCVESTDCLSQVCGPQHTCVECVTDDDCDSKLCLGDNKCAIPEDVVYVGGDNPTMNTTCSRETPCQNLEQALYALASRKYIKVTGPIVEFNGATITDKNVTIYGRSGAKILRATAGEVLIIKGMMVPKVALIDLEIEGNASAGGKDCVEIAETASVTMVRVDVHGHGQAGVSLAYGTAKLVMSESKVHDNMLEGIVVAGGTLELRRSWLYGNKGNGGVYTMSGTTATIDSSVITGNTGTFGASINGNYTLRNNIISANGNPLGTTAGVILNSASGIFEFNTVADNATTGTDLGISCSAAGIMIWNNILTGNTVNGCSVAYSLTDLLMVDIPGIGNKKGNPMFVKVTEPLQSTYYRLMPGSEARDSADPAATLDVDIDGEPRNDARRDVGADEFKMN